MKIESEVTKLSRYGDDGLEGFYTAVDNGQARLAMTILVDVIAAFADKIDELEAAILPKEEEVKPPAVEVKQEEQIITPEVIKNEQKVKPAVKEPVLKEPISE